MTELVRYESARAALAEARSVDEVKDIHDQAEAMRLYGRMAKDVQLETDAAEIRLRAERRLGLLIDAQKRTVGMNKGALLRGSQSEPRDQRPTLADAGIDKKLSSRSQKVAQIPEAEFESALAGVRARMAENVGRVSLDIVRDREKAVVKEAHGIKIRGGGVAHDLVALAASGYRASVILADPPWHFKARSEKGEGRSANQHYTTNPLDAIKALQVEALAAKDCVLLIWTLDWCPDQALEVIKAWGFEHKTTAFTWVKQNASGNGMFMGQGYWTRANPETCWLATRGSPQRLDASVRQLLIAPIQEHSRKPDELYSRIERLVGGPYLEIYARRPREGWTSWGNELASPIPAGALPPHDPETGEIYKIPQSATQAAAVTDVEPNAGDHAAPGAFLSGDGEAEENHPAPEPVGQTSDLGVTAGETAPISESAAAIAASLGTGPRWQNQMAKAGDVDLDSSMPAFLRRGGKSP